MNVSPPDVVPTATPVKIQLLEPVRRLWRIPPNLPENTCPGCQHKVDRAQITAANHQWHPECFRCSLCREPFTDNKFGIQDDIILHQHCYLHAFAPRCAICTEPVSQTDGAQAIQKVYHRKCFKCSKCGRGDLKKFDSLNGFPYCHNCFEYLKQFFPRCVTCQKAVLPHQKSKDFFFESRKYFVHDNECFKCAYCSNHPQECRAYQNKLVCGICYDNAFKKICATCNEPIFDAGNRMDNIYWHTEHFVCSICNTPLKPNTNLLVFGVLKCRNCSNEEKPKCKSCGKPVEDLGVKFAGDMYHMDCFTCQICGVRLKSKSIPNVGGRPCCESCHQSLIDEGKVTKKGKILVKNIDDLFPTSKRRK